jgi:hypothetical protein
MVTKTLSKPPTRAALLKQLAVYASAEFVAMASRDSSDAQIAAYVEGAKSQREARHRAGIRDMRPAKA